MTATLIEQPLPSTNVNHIDLTQAEQPQTGPREHTVASYAWAVSRISIGFVFLWAFLDKTFALGYASDLPHGSRTAPLPLATYPESVARSKASLNLSLGQHGLTGCT